MPVSLRELADLVGGDLIGSADLAVSGAGTLSEAKADEITFLDQAEKAARLAASHAAAAVVPRGIVLGEKPLIAVDDVHRAFAAVVSHFRPRRQQRRSGISAGAFVSPSARLGCDVDVHPGAVIGDDVEIGAGSTIHSGAQIMAGCKLGERVTVYPSAVLYEDTRVGDRSIIHACAVLGADGFGYKLVSGRHQLQAQLGCVELGADVEIGAGTTIDRGAYGATRIGEGTKIDDQVMIGHNCQIGRHNLICAQVGIGGSTTSGDYVVIAGQAGIRDHVHLGARSILGAKAGVSQDIPEGLAVLGAPAIPEREQKVQFAAIAKLPQMRREFKALQRAVADLQAQQGPQDRQAAA